MTERSIPLSVDAFQQQAASLDQAIDRAEHGEIVPVIARGEHVADVVPSGEVHRLRETIEVLSDSEAMHALAVAEQAVAEGDLVEGQEAIRALFDERDDV